jgi:DNA-binding response OmpR family regulator
VLAEGRRVGLTVREYELFTALASRPDQVMQRPEIYEIVWGGAMRHRDRSVDVVVRKIRGKFERLAPGWRYIHTHFGVGYRFNPERTSPLVADGTSLDVAGVALGQVEGAAE